MSATTTESREPAARSDAQLRWRCRRGMRELDTLLTRYIDKRYAAAPSRERDAFARLLELPDPDLFGYLVGRTQAAEGPMRDVVAWIRNSAY